MTEADSKQQTADSPDVRRLAIVERVAVHVDVPLDGSPAAIRAPEGYPIFCALQATTSPGWKPRRGDEKSGEGDWVQYPALIVIWGKQS